MRWIIGLELRAPVLETAMWLQTTAAHPLKGTVTLLVRVAQSSSYSCVYTKYVLKSCHSCFFINGRHTGTLTQMGCWHFDNCHVAIVMPGTQIELVIIRSQINLYKGSHYHYLHLTCRENKAQKRCSDSLQVSSHQDSGSGEQNPVLCSIH